MLEDVPNGSKIFIDSTRSSAESPSFRVGKSA